MAKIRFVHPLFVLLPSVMNFRQVPTCGLILWGLFVPLGTVPALAERYALVVGIDNYTWLEPLRKATNDARAVADTLKSAGFGVTLALDLDADALYDQLARFTAALRPGDDVVIYFAGHGVEVDGRNWLLPADMAPLRPGDEVKLRRAALATDDLLSEITARGPQITLMILDACRDNPFSRQGTRSVGTTRGLARLDAPRGTYVIYSAGAGQTALDRLGEGDRNPNSVFTRALLPRLSQPGLSIRDLAQEVRMEVDATARSIGHDQFPAIYDQLAGEFSILPTALNTTLPVAQSPATPAPSKAPLSNPCILFETRVAKAKNYGTQTRIGVLKDLRQQARETVCVGMVQSALNEALAEAELSSTTEPLTTKSARPSSVVGHGATLGNDVGVILGGAQASERFFRLFDNPDGKPLLSLLLVDDGRPADRAALAALPIPVTIVIDPLSEGAAERQALWRSLGQEVVLSVSGIPQGATSANLERSFQQLLDRLPRAIAVIDPDGQIFQDSRPLATMVVAILQSEGLGLVTFDRGQNVADQLARRDGVGAVRLFRTLDAAGEAAPVIRRYLDRAAFKAAQDGQVAVIGSLREETVTAIMEWVVAGRSATVALAPISALIAP